MHDNPMSPLRQRMIEDMAVPTRNLVPAHRTHHFVQLQVRLLIDQSKQKPGMRLRRDAPAPAAS